MVSSDDRNIEKKDKGLDEPVQFYNGKDPVLYELVVNVIRRTRCRDICRRRRAAQSRPERNNDGHCIGADAERGTLIASPFLFAWIDYFFFAAFFAGFFLAAFLAAFLVAILPILPSD